MSTSEPDKIGTTGPLDPSVLARMANEFFTALPDFVPLAQSALAEAQRAADLSKVSGVPTPLGRPAAVAAIPVPEIPSETQVRALPANSAIPPVQAQVPAIPGTAVPEIPGGVTETRYGGWRHFLS
jgi:cysteine desulfurase / selenocysteine lyase